MAPSPAPSPRIRLIVRSLQILALATFLGLLSAAQIIVSNMAAQREWTFEHAIIMQLPFWLLWAPFVPLVFAVTRRIPFERHSMPRALALHGGIGLLITALHYGVQIQFMHMIGHGYEDGHSYIYHFFWQMRFNFAAHIMGYLAVLGGVLIIDYYRKYRERELLASQLSAQLYQAKLQALRMQLNPHFLFNAMNSIAMLVRRSDNNTAVRTIAGLSDLLRYVLEDAPADEVPLRDEIGFLERYLGIEKIRFQDRLRVRIETPDETLDAFVPNLVLQPLVENALRHGVGRKIGGGSIEIIARRQGGRLILEVRDDGPGVDGAGTGDGIGLANTRTRLQQLYGTEQSFELRSEPRGGAVASVSLPYHVMPSLRGEESVA